MLLARGGYVRTPVLITLPVNFSFIWQPRAWRCILDTQWLDGIVLLQVSGIIIGMLLMGYIADQIGRKWGSVLTSAFMFIGGILLTCSTGPTIQGWAIMFAISQFIFGYGVGGEVLPRKPPDCLPRRKLRHPSPVMYFTHQHVAPGSGP